MNIFRSSLLILSIDTLKRMRYDLLKYVEDLAKDVGMTDVRDHLAQVINDINTIESSIKELGGSLND